MKKQVIAAMLALSFAGGASAEEDALVTLKVMTPETALRLAQTALKDCRDKGFQTAVAVVDRFGTLQVLLRDRFAGPHTPETARRKAWTAVSFRTDTEAMVGLTGPGKEAAGVRFVEDAMMVGGGVPVTAAGSIVGGIGVSGAPSGEADDGCARAGIDEVQGDLDF